MKRCRHRDVVFTRNDERAFCRALREAYPDVVFARTAQCGDPGMPLLPDPTGQNWPLVEGFRIPRGWAPEIELNRFGRPVVTNISYRFRFHYHRCMWKWVGLERMAFDDPTLEEGFFRTWHDPDDKELCDFAKTIWRIVGKISTNHLRAELPSQGIVYGEERGSYWAGHDALRWCSGHKRRMLMGRRRPAATWTFPDLPWYDGLAPTETPEKPARYSGCMA